MDLSLTICTRDRHHRLIRCLESVRRLIFDQPWELIVVDNGSTDKTAAVVSEFIETVNFRAIYLFEPKGRQVDGPEYRTRDSERKILVFTDDDCYPAPDFLSQVWSAFDDPSVGYIGGRIMLHDPDDYPITINESMTRRG